MGNAKTEKPATKIVNFADYHFKNEEDRNLRTKEMRERGYETKEIAHCDNRSDPFTVECWKLTPDTKTIIRKELPARIKNEMKLFRLGIESIPDSYVGFHQALAREQIEKLKEQGYRVHNIYMEFDGWMDGMRVLYAIIENRKDNLIKIKWNDSNQEFFACHVECGGSSPLRLSSRRIK